MFEEGHLHRCETCDDYIVKGYEGLMRIIKESSLPEGDDGYNYFVNFYDMAKKAFNKSYSFREYLKFLGVDKANKIDKNLKLLWPFTYRIASRKEPRITISHRDPDDFGIQWVRNSERHMMFDGRMMEDFEMDESKKIN